MQGDHYKLIREIGAASIVLLKNTAGALPLSAATIKRASARLAAAGTPPVLIFVAQGSRSWARTRGRTRMARTGAASESWIALVLVCLRARLTARAT